MFGKSQEKIVREKEEKEMIFDELSNILEQIKVDHPDFFSLEGYEAILELEDIERKMNEDSACIGQLEIEVLIEYFLAIVEKLQELEGPINLITPYNPFQVGNYMPETFEEFREKLAKEHGQEDTEDSEDVFEIIETGVDISIGATVKDIKRMAFEALRKQQRHFAKSIKLKQQIMKKTPENQAENLEQIERSIFNKLAQHKILTLEIIKSMGGLYNVSPIGYATLSNQEDVERELINVYVSYGILNLDILRDKGFLITLQEMKDARLSPLERKVVLSKGLVKTSLEFDNSLEVLERESMDIRSQVEENINITYPFFIAKGPDEEQ